MNRTPQQRLEAQLQAWAASETAHQVTPITPAMLRIKHRLALQDARRCRHRRVALLFLVMPAVGALLGAVFGAGAGLGLLERLSLLGPGGYMTMGGAFVLLAALGQAWSEG